MSVTSTAIPQRNVHIPAQPHLLEGILSLPDGAEGVVLFAHGSGSGRFSPRNQLVAGTLQQAGLATLLMDLLDPVEAEDRAAVFDIDLLAQRLLCAADWLAQQPSTKDLRLGLFGASTGAGAALQAAAQRPQGIAAVVSRGGRPDLAPDFLPAVQAPTLLLVGGDDAIVLDLNRQALAMLNCTKDLVVIPGASHLFAEPGALEQVARLAQAWFERFLPSASG